MPRCCNGRKSLRLPTLELARRWSLLAMVLGLLALLGVPATTFAATDTDLDDDGVPNALEAPADTDGDGLPDQLDPDSDNDGLLDGTEMGLRLQDLSPDTDLTARVFVADIHPASQTNPRSADTDADGVRDGAEDLNHNGAVDAGESDPATAASFVQPLDSDGDGLPDAEELLLGALPLDRDSDDDGIDDGNEWNFAVDTDRDGAANVVDPDSDGDGLPDGLERGAALSGLATFRLRGNFLPDTDTTSTTSPLRADSDGDGQRDGLEDVNRNGKVDGGEGDPNLSGSTTTVSDSDGDGLSDSEEAAIGSGVLDLDSDDDGLADGQEPDPLFDRDGDGLPSALDVDSDDDGIWDGTERGVTVPIADKPGVSGTNLAKGHFLADLQPLSRTLALSPDSDGDGQPDGFEDPNHDGAVGPGEGDALDPATKAPAVDSDGDGLSDSQEARYGSFANDGDSDDDGIPDGMEANPGQDHDGDGFDNLLDEDADDDGLFDGTEVGLTLQTLPMATATDLGSSVFVADEDPSSRTFPLRADSDNGGLADGLEDFSANGKLDTAETDPTVAGDDTQYNPDLDGDSLDNATEIALGTDPRSADTDGDGIADPTEVSDPIAPFDSDGDGWLDALDLDSDGDGVGDAQESGLVAGGSIVLPQNVADSDGDGTPDYRDLDSDDDQLSDGAEVYEFLTDPRLADTDGGGLRDDVEVLQVLTNPLDPADDKPTIEAGLLVRGTSPFTACSSSPVAGSGGVGWLLGLVAAVVLTRRRWSGVAALLAVVCLAQPVWAADDLPPMPDVTGWRQNSDGHGILQVEAARQGQPLALGFATQMHYSVRPLVVASESKVERDLVGRRVQADVGLSLRLVDNLTIAAWLPMNLTQKGTLPSRDLGAGELQGGFGLGDLALTAKYVFVPEAPGRWGWAATTTVTAPTGDPTRYLGRPGVTVAPTAVVSGVFGIWRFAANMGPRLQESAKLFNLTDGPVWRSALAVTVAPAATEREGWQPSGIWLDASLHHETPLTEPFSRRYNERLEGGVGLSWQLDNRLVATMGTGVGLWPGHGVPAWRPFLTVRYLPTVDRPVAAVKPRRY
jgi:hypothetical protein